VCRERIILLLVAVAAAIPTGLTTRQSAQRVALTGFSIVSSSRGFVHVGGDVDHPGMYPLAANMVTVSVIKMAVPRGPLKNVVPAALAAQYLKNGDDVRLVIGGNGQGRVTVGSMPPSEKIVLGIPLDINAMGVADFVLVPGIGPKTAERIVEYRQNNGGSMAPEELLNVAGIGEKKYKSIQKYF